MPSPTKPQPTVEFVVDPRTGRVRQAGADREGAEVERFRLACEQSLWLFAKGIMGYNLLNRSLHLEFCNFLQNTPSYRKLTLIPRGHLKTTCLKSMAVHQTIQPDGQNVYFKSGIGSLGHSRGTSTRIVFTSKTASLAQDSLSEIALTYETNTLLRALWPHCVWQDPAKEARVWNRERIVLPRTDNFKEATIETLGVGGQSAGYHFNTIIFDDLIDEEAANSPLVMHTTIDWFKTARSLVDHPERTLLFANGTRWAVADLYQYILDEEITFDPYIRRAIEDGKPIFPEVFSLESLDDLRRTQGVMFPLLYMNEAADPSLIDFDMSLVRRYTINDGKVVFDEEERDVFNAARSDRATEQLSARANGKELKRGTKLDKDGWDALAAREDYVKLRRAHTS